MSAYFTTETDGMSWNLSSIIQADQSHLAVSAEKVIICEQSKELSLVSTVGFRTEHLIVSCKEISGEEVTSQAFYTPKKEGLHS